MENFERPDAKITLLPDVGDKEHTTTIEEIGEGAIRQVKNGDQFRLVIQDDEFPDDLPYTGRSGLLNWEVVATIEDDVTVSGTVVEVDTSGGKPEIIIIKEVEKEHEGNNLLYD